jgi:hypothetical protein
VSRLITRPHPHAKSCLYFEQYWTRLAC